MLDLDVSVQLFNWLYGREYEAVRSVKLESEGRALDMPIKFSVDHMINNLIHGLIEYFWGDHDSPTSKISAKCKRYFLSIYPLMDPKFFSTTILNRKDHRITYGLDVPHSMVVFNHWFIARMNGYLTEFEVRQEKVMDDVMDSEGLNEFKAEFGGIRMPQEFYDLEEYVINQGKKGIIEFHHLI